MVDLALYFKEDTENRYEGPNTDLQIFPEIKRKIFTFN